MVYNAFAIRLPGWQHCHVLTLGLLFVFMNLVLLFRTGQWTRRVVVVTIKSQRPWSDHSLYHQPKPVPRMHNLSTLYTVPPLYQHRQCAILPHSVQSHWIDSVYTYIQCVHTLPSLVQSIGAKCSLQNLHFINPNGLLGQGGGSLSWSIRGYPWVSYTLWYSI